MKFYCTAGRGTETFLGKELRRVFKEKLLELKVIDGKVFFELADDVEEIEKVLQLKIAERAFAQVVFVKTSELDQRNLLNSVKRSLNNKAAWNDSLAVIGMIHLTGKVDVSVQNQTDVRECKSISDSLDEPVPKKARLVAGGAIEETDTTFRVNFKCPACFRKRLDIKTMPRQLGIHIKHVTGWKVDLRNPLNEICIQLNNDYLTIGIPLTREPLSKRSFIKLIGLRSTIAHIMVELLQIQPGDTVLDPMCGKATILLEAAHCLKNIRYIGIDKSESQLKSARENVQFAQLDNIQLINGDATDLPFPDGSIDKIVTDAPFGNTHTTDMPLEDFYRKILQEFSRVLSPSGKLVILTSSTMKEFITEILALSASPSAATDSAKSNKSTSDSGCETNFKTEKNFDKLHEKPMTHNCDTDTGFSVEEGKTNVNSEVNVDILALNVPCDDASRKPSGEGFLFAALQGTEGQQSTGLKIKETSKSANQKDSIKSEETSEPEISLVTGVTNGTQELVTDTDTLCASDSNTGQNHVKRDTITSVSGLNKRRGERISDMTRTNDGINLSDNNTSAREDMETNILDQNKHTSGARSAVIHKETRIESDGKQTQNSASETNIGDCKDCVHLSDRRPDESIAVETRGIKKPTKLNQMVLTESHYVKLGETHAYICVLVKTKIK